MNMRRIFTTLVVVVFLFTSYKIWHFTYGNKLMVVHHSPWLEELQRKRAMGTLSSGMTSDVAIVGGGIAGIVTAYFILKETKRNVILLEATKVAHGATGHNAGQIAAYNEKSLVKRVKEFGQRKAIQAQEAIENAWQLLDEIYKDAQLKTPLHAFDGYDGCASIDDLMELLEDNQQRILGGLDPHQIYVARIDQVIAQIPMHYNGQFELVDQSFLQSLLDTDSTEYIAVHVEKRGCLNSAAFTEELASYLLQHYPTRFTLYEESPVTTIRLGTDQAALLVDRHEIKANHIVLCTNGFENFSIINDAGPAIDGRFHHMVMGKIGYMIAYLEERTDKAWAASYLPPLQKNRTQLFEIPYFYLTRRPFKDDSKKKNIFMTCVGGPEHAFPDQQVYNRTASYPMVVKDAIEDFLAQEYRPYKKHKLYKMFYWHGLMGYTPNGMRRIGPEPCNPILLYNLGCNGVGILPSIYGGKKIVGFIQGKTFELSVFDPVDCRCSES